MPSFIFSTKNLNPNINYLRFALGFFVVSTGSHAPPPLIINISVVVSGTVVGNGGTILLVTMTVALTAVGGGLFVGSHDFFNDDGGFTTGAGIGGSAFAGCASA